MLYFLKKSSTGITWRKIAFKLHANEDFVLRNCRKDVEWHYPKSKIAFLSVLITYIISPLNAHFAMCNSQQRHSPPVGAREPAGVGFLGHERRCKRLLHPRPHWGERAGVRG